MGQRLTQLNSCEKRGCVYGGNIRVVGYQVVILKFSISIGSKPNLMCLRSLKLGH